MGRAVLLQHDDPGDAGSHFDLLIERDTPAGAPLISFRLAEPLDPRSVAEFHALRTPDHRPVYLDYEGPLPAPGNPASRARGRVTRLWRVPAALLAETPDFLEVSLADARFTAERLAPLNEWRFTRA